MLNFLRFVCLHLTLSAALPAAAQEKPAPIPQAPAAAAAAAAAAAPVAAPPAPAQPAPAFKVDKPTPDDLRFDRERPDLVTDDSEGLLGSLLRMVLVLGLVLALVYLSLNWGLRKLMRLSPTRNAVVKVHERIPLEAKKTVYLVEAGDEFLLLGVGESEVSYLTRLDAERTRAALAKRSEAPAPALAGKPFWERLLVKPPPGDVRPEGSEAPDGSREGDQGGAQGGPAPTA